MPNFVWIISSDQQSSLGRGGISSAYIIPQGQMHGHEKELRGERLWIFLRGVEDRCIAAVTIKKVEKFSEGYHAGDFLLSCDLTASLRLTANFEGAKAYTSADLRSRSIGVHSLNDNIADALKARISSAIAVKLAVPTDTVLARVKLDALPRKGAGLAKTALTLITQTLPLDQIWASGVGAKLSPFSNFASRLLSLHGHNPAASEISVILKNYDPIATVLKTMSELESKKDATPPLSIEKSVDLDFTEIDPETVYAREFIPSNGRLPDLESALSKTEAAEKLHQSMLRDISSYLQGIKLPPYESGSVDLMVFYGGRTKIFEIKSSTVINIIAQAAKGAFQIACYVNAMKTDYAPLDAALILHRIGDRDLEKFTYDALEHLGVRYLIYDPECEWPNRVSGLLD